MTQAHYHQSLYAQGMASSSSGLSGKAHAQFQDRLDRAHRRYLSAIKALAQVRKMQLPAVQVNIAAQGGQQVNVGGGDRSTARSSRRR